MNLEALFSGASALVIPAWVLLVVAPGWRWTRRLATVVTPTLLSLLYLYLFVMQFRVLGGSFTTLARVGQLFAVPTVMLAGWIHYLAFDLLVGSWMARDGMQRNIPRLVMIPCLLLTLLLGPFGLLVYRGIRWARTGDVWEAE
ncbi:MAG: ABA4-like family protein [Acidobacteria bacterium]|nr:ABA4-like family protein [Acidobacteriota bacterium]